jgi:hypothetical protein
MMSYRIHIFCDVHGCKKPPSNAVYYDSGAHLGNYCLQHAERKVSELKQQEKREAANAST